MMASKSRNGLSVADTPDWADLEDGWFMNDADNSRLNSLSFKEKMPQTGNGDNWQTWIWRPTANNSVNGGVEPQSMKKALKAGYLLPSFCMAVFLCCGCAYFRPGATVSEAQEKNPALNDPSTWWWREGHSFGSWTVK